MKAKFHFLFATLITALTVGCEKETNNVTTDTDIFLKGTWRYFNGAEHVYKPRTKTAIGTKVPTNNIYGFIIGEDYWRNVVSTGTKQWAYDQIIRTSNGGLFYYKSTAVAIGNDSLFINTQNYGNFYLTRVMPDCPCNYNDARRLGRTSNPEGEWRDCGTASQTYHFGATTEVRWLPDESGDPGQQCTYDVNGKLITGGLAAGSFDRVSPRTCGFVTGSSFDHYNNDVKPWEELPCWQYLRDWPANNSLACGTNIVSGISNIINGVDNLKKMIGDMTCEEATLLIRSAKETTPPIIDATLRNYIIGSSASLTQQECKTRLQAWKGSVLCTSEPALCAVLTKAINNL